MDTVSFCNDENVLKSDRADGCTTLNTLRATELYILKRVNFTLYFKKSVIKNSGPNSNKQIKRKKNTVLLFFNLAASARGKNNSNQRKQMDFEVEIIK